MIWINGPFGGGKSTAAEALVAQRGDLRLYDPEHVGYLLMSNLQGVEFDDFQDLPAWRQLVPVVARHLTAISGQRLVAVQSVLDRRYWAELRSGLANEGIDVCHVVLDVDRATLQTRIENDRADPDIRQWRLDHIEAYLGAQRWLVDDADLVVDTTTLDPDGVVKTVVASLG